MGTVVYRVQAEDQDSGANGHLLFDLYSSSGTQRTFSIDRSSGEIRLVGSLSYESIPRYDLQVIAKDGGVPQLSATFVLVVHVQAENEHGPVFDTLSYRVEIKEGTPINKRFLQVRALNRETPGSGYSSPLSYHLRPDGDSAAFGIAPDSGWLFVKSTLDREVKDMYLLTVLATQGHGQLKKTGSATVRISVTDENDNSPRFTQDRVFMAVKENLPAGTGFGHVSATDRDGGLNGRLSYRCLHPDRHFQINSHTGECNYQAVVILISINWKVNFWLNDYVSLSTLTLCQSHQYAFSSVLHSSLRIIISLFVCLSRGNEYKDCSGQRAAVKLPASGVGSRWRFSTPQRHGDCLHHCPWRQWQ